MTEPIMDQQPPEPTPARLNWHAAAYALAFSGSFCLYFAIFTSPDLRARYDQFRAGMSAAEVEASFGCPPGDYASGPHLFVPGLSHATKRPDGSAVHIWIFDGCMVIVWFDANGQLHNKAWQTIGSKPSLSERVCHQLGM